MPKAATAKELKISIYSNTNNKKPPTAAPQRQRRAAAPLPPAQLVGTIKITKGDYVPLSTSLAVLHGSISKMGHYFGGDRTVIHMHSN